MTVRVVTACNRAYAAQNLALYRSIREHLTGAWEFWWVALDWATQKGLGLSRFGENLRVISQDEVRATNPYLSVALGRAEADAWFWIWASQAAEYACWRDEVLTLYVDSDCYALADWRPVLDEMRGADVGMLSHRFPAHRLASHGDRGRWWCGFNAFAPTLRGRAAASWWAAFVRQRCDRHDPGDPLLQIPAGLGGDQAPLEVLPRIAATHEFQRPGFIASWNADGEHDLDTAWLWHAHEYRYDQRGDRTVTTGYGIPAGVQDRVVAPYEAAVKAAAQELWG